VVGTSHLTQLLLFREGFQIPSDALSLPKVDLTLMFWHLAVVVVAAAVQFDQPFEAEWFQ